MGLFSRKSTMYPLEVPRTTTLPLPDIAMLQNKKHADGYRQFTSQVAQIAEDNREEYMPACVAAVVTLVPIAQATFEQDPILASTFEEFFEAAGDRMGGWVAATSFGVAAGHLEQASGVPDGAVHPYAHTALTLMPAQVSEDHCAGYLMRAGHWMARTGKTANDLIAATA